jgi:hypothetical protein
MNTSIVYIVFELDRLDDPIGVYYDRRLAEGEAKFLGLKNWFILARELKG